MGNCFFSKKKLTKKPSETLILGSHDQTNNGNPLAISVKGDLQSQGQSGVKQRKEARNNKLLQLSFKEEVFENVERIEKNKGPSDYQKILNALGQHYFFEKLSYQHK